jgi:hypothetical protein
LLYGSYLLSSECVLDVFSNVDVAFLEGAAAFVDYVGGDLGERDEVRVGGVGGIDWVVLGGWDLEWGRGRKVP